MAMRNAGALILSLLSSGCFLSHELDREAAPPARQDGEPRRETTACPAESGPPSRATWEVRNEQRIGDVIATDPDGDVLVAGLAGHRGWIEKRAERDGALVWVAETTSPVIDLDVDSAGNVVVIDEVGTISAFDSDGGMPLWSRAHEEGAAEQRGTGVSVARSGQVYGTGVTLGEPPDPWTLVGARVWVRALDVAGNELWTFWSDGPGDGTDWSIGVATDPDGGVVVAGYGHLLADESPPTPWAILLDPAGEVRWERTWSSGLLHDVQADATGDFVVSGSVHRPGEDPEWEIWNWKLSADGAERWAVAERDGAGVSLAVGPCDEIVASRVTSTDGHYTFGLSLLDRDGHLAWTTAAGESQHPAIDDRGAIVTTEFDLSMPDGLTRIRRFDP